MHNAFLYKFLSLYLKICSCYILGKYLVFSFPCRAEVLGRQRQYPTHCGWRADCMELTVDVASHAVFIGYHFTLFHMQKRATVFLACGFFKNAIACGFFKNAIKIFCYADRRNLQT